MHPVDTNVRVVIGMPSRVGDRGQITVEKAIRDELAVYAGDQAIQWVQDGRLIVEFVPAPHSRSLAGSLAGKSTKRPADDEWSKVVAAARAIADPDRG